MSPLRSLLFRHRAFVALLVAAALAIKALVPAGLMIGTGAKTLTVEICADALGTHLTKQIAIAVVGNGNGGSKSNGQSGDHAKDGGACPFGALGMAGLGGADPVLLAAALAFILALGVAPPRPVRIARGQRLRPPLRAPPTPV